MIVSVLPERVIGGYFRRPRLASVIADSSVHCWLASAIPAFKILRLFLKDHVTTLTSGLDAGPRGALNDIMKALTKVAGQNEPKEEEMDNSIVV